MPYSITNVPLVFEQPNTFGLLRGHRERPCRGTAEQRDEVAAPHSSTSSAKM
jgi:hypothetical protein